MSAIIKNVGYDITIESKKLENRYIELFDK
jgi:hypothetical protein